MLHGGRTRRTLLWLQPLLFAEPFLLSWLERFDLRWTHTHEDRLASLSNEIKFTNYALAVSSTNEHQLQSELEALRAELATTRNILSASSARETSLRNQLQASETALAQSYSAAKSLQVALAMSLDTSLQQETASAERETVVQQELNDARKELERLRAALADADVEYAIMQRAVDDIRTDARHARLMADARIDVLEEELHDMRRYTARKSSETERGRGLPRKPCRSDGEPSSHDLLAPPSVQATTTFLFPRLSMIITVDPPAEPFLADCNVLSRQTLDNLAVYPQYRTVSGRTLRAHNSHGNTVWTMWDKGCEWCEVFERGNTLMYADGHEVDVE